jgi:hypothetical protein
MSAPVVERPRTATRTAPASPSRSAPAPGTPRVRRPEPHGATRTDHRTRPAARTAARAVPGGRAPFVLTVMALLGVGLVATLWLSTAAAADSYRLQDARTAARELSERSERLHREVAALQSPPALAQRAAQLGMVPAKDPARLVVAADGAVRVVGDATPAVAPPVVAALPGGLDGGVAPRARSVPALESAPEQVAAAAVAAARPAAEEARKAAEEAAAQDDAAQDDANQDDATEDAAAQDAADQNGAAQEGTTRSAGQRAAAEGTRDSATADTQDTEDTSATAGTRRARTDAG